MIEKRKDERLPVRFEVQLSAGADQREGMLVNVSRNGAQVVAREAWLRPETEVRVIVQRRGGRTIELTGQVRWSNSERFALVFSGLDLAAQKWLDSLLEEEGTAVR